MHNEQDTMEEWDNNPVFKTQQELENWETEAIMPPFKLMFENIKKRTLNRFLQCKNCYGHCGHCSTTK